MRSKFWVSLLFCSILGKCSGELQFIQVWFRHGERLPTHFLELPGDPPGKQYLEIGEPGELTIKGIRQEYELGKTLRNDYGDFLGSYVPSLLHTWTGQDNRTVTSAQAVMAGLFPPTTSQLWNPDLNWQPTSMHTDYSIDWVSTGIFDHCPVYTKNFLKRADYEQLPSKLDQKVLETIQKASLAQLSTAVEINRLLDSLEVRLLLNDSRLPFPTWAESVRDLISPTHSLLHSLLLDLQNETIAAYHLEQVLSAIEDHLSRPEGHRNKAMFMSGHDTNIMVLGKAFGIKETLYQLPYFGSHLVVELHLRNGRYELEFALSMGAGQEAKKVLPKFCQNPCTLEQMQAIGKPRLTKQEMLKECNGLTTAESGYVITGALLVLTAILLISTIVLACSNCSYKKRLRSATDPERRALL